jgi:hypothetical protein
LSSVIPLLGVGAFWNVELDQAVDHFVAHVLDGFGNRFRVHQFLALFEDDLALVVHHVIELEQVLADVEVARLDLFWAVRVPC